MVGASQKRTSPKLTVCIDHQMATAGTSIVNALVTTLYPVDLVLQLHIEVQF